MTSHRYTDFLLSNFRSDGLMAKLLGSLLMARVNNDNGPLIGGAA